MNVNRIKKMVKNSTFPPFKIALKIWAGFHHILDKLSFTTSTPIYYFVRLFPLQNKVVASTFMGRKYGDNTKFIVEELLKIEPKIEIKWVKNFNYKYQLPSNIKPISRFSFWRVAYEYATAKVWLDTHRFPSNAKKRKGQLVIETWHGGLGIKKIDGDVSKFRQLKRISKEVETTSILADIFISQSSHLSKVYRSAFDYKGKIWKIGYPKNDMLFFDNEPYQKKIKQYFNFNQDDKICVYAPTFRDDFWSKGINKDVYAINFMNLKQALNKRFSGEWKILARWHPLMLRYVTETKMSLGSSVIDATCYPEMQDLIMAADAFVSDYSSCIFDAAIREIPCFTFATDFEEYKLDRGVYYEMEDLPFPYARNNEELEQNILAFDEKEYKNAWSAFKLKTGLFETGHAAKDIAFLINEFMKGNKNPLEEIKGEP